MTADFKTWAADIRRLVRALAALEPAAAHLGVAPPAGREWYELLRLRLLPQIDAEPYLVVAFVGGTNIGKSLLFNHLAGEVASAVSPLAAGTKHPVCLAPPGMDDPATLERIFEGFRLVPWEKAEDALAASEEDLLFWRTGANVPPRLLLLDAPDVDSDAPMNWRRARQIRQVADVLIAVLTQQKYNDAAVKQFFREAVQADKPFVAVFNQVDLEGDRDYWPQWLTTFRGSTGANPELVYVVPRDRQAAAALTLPFHEVGPDGCCPPGPAADLRDELAKMHFDAIKIRTFRGALARVLDAQAGAPAWLDEIRAASAEFEAAHKVLAAAEMARVAWPSLPTGVLVEEIRQWWDNSRSHWSRGIHSFYRAVGRGVTWPIRKVWRQTVGPAAEPLEAFHRRERQAVLDAVQKMLDELERLSQVGNETLKPKLRALLGGAARADLLARVEAAHQALPDVDDDYRLFLQNELDAWQTSNPGAVKLLRTLDNAVAVARPAVTVALFVTGLHVAGDLVGQVATHAAGHIAQEAAIAGGTTVVGEAGVAGANEGFRQAAGRLFGTLQAQYARQRAAWLYQWLEQSLLGGLLADLRSGAETPQAAAFTEAQSALARLGL